MSCRWSRQRRKRRRRERVKNLVREKRFKGKRRSTRRSRGSYDQGGNGMITYKVFLKNGDLSKEDLIGVLAERRKDLRGETQIKSGLEWANLIFGDLVEDRHAIFIVPDELRPVDLLEAF